MRYAKVSQPRDLRIETGPVPEPGAGEVLIRVAASGICGTDLHILQGTYMGQYPVVPGHEFSGVIERTGAGVSRFRAGDRVAVEPNIACDNCWHCLNNRQNFCLHWQGIGVTVARPGAMAQYVTAPERAVFDIGGLSFEEGAFMEPLSCVLHGLQRAEVPLGAHVAIIGAGPIGILLLRAIRSSGGARLTVVERNPSRAAFACASGAEACFAEPDRLEEDRYDVVVDASGSIAAMRQTLRFVRHGGTLLWFGVPPAGQTMEIEPFVIFRKGLKVLSSFTSVRNSYQALDMLQAGRIEVRDIVSHRLPLEELGRGIEMIEKGEDGVRKVLILPNEAEGLR